MNEATHISICNFRFLAVLTAMLFIMSSVGCKDKLGPEPSEIYGFWTATKVEFVGKAGQGTVNATDAGWTATLTLNADNTGDLAVTPKDADTWHWAGAWEIDGDLLRIVGQGADVQLSGSTLYLTGFDGSYDFNNDSEIEPAKLNLVMVK